MSYNKQKIIDARNPSEFSGGNVARIINIPLQEMLQRLDEIISLQQPIVLCCASGGRSGLATAFFKNQGLQCENGGSWRHVIYIDPTT